MDARIKSGHDTEDLSSSEVNTDKWRSTLDNLDWSHPGVR